MNDSSNLQARIEELEQALRVASLENKILKSEVEKLSRDKLTGLRRGDLLHSHLAQVLRAMLSTPAAERLLDGEAVENLSEPEWQSVQMLAVFLDLAYLSLFNHFGESHGDRVLQALGAELRARFNLDGQKRPIFHGRSERGSDTMVSAQFAARSNGSEVFLCITSDLEGAARTIQATAVAMRNKNFLPAPLPAHLDWGSCSLIEAFTAAAVWIKSQGAPRNHEAFVTLMKQILLGIAAERVERAKTMSRIALLCRIRRMGTPEVFAGAIPHIVRGAHTISTERLDRIIAAAEMEDIESGKRLFDEMLLEAGVGFAVDEIFETRVANTERILREIARFNGDTRNLRLLVMLAANDQLGDFEDTIRRVPK